MCVRVREPFIYLEPAGEILELDSRSVMKFRSFGDSSSSRVPCSGQVEDDAYVAGR